MESFKNVRKLDPENYLPGGTTSVADPRRILDPGSDFSIPDPGSSVDKTRSKNLSIFTPKRTPSSQK
jgi:hypothetical protein